MKRQTAAATVVDTEKEKALETLRIVEMWLGESKNLHQPYLATRRIDGSMTPTAELSDRLANGVAAETFCNECGTRWPCRSVDTLRTLQKILDYKMQVQFPVNPQQRGPILRVAY